MIFALLLRKHIVFVNTVCAHQLNMRISSFRTKVFLLCSVFILDSFLKSKGTFKLQSDL